MKKWIDEEGSEDSADLERETTTIKRFITLVAFLIVNCSAFSQGYISTSVVNKGIAATVGILAGKLDINVGVQFPITEVTVPTIYHFQSGIMINLTHNEEGDNYSVTPSIGGALANKKEVVPANTFNEKYGTIMPYETLKDVSQVLPYYSLEFGKDAYLGRVFLKTVYCGNLYYSVGMRLFFNRYN